MFWWRMLSLRNDIALLRLLRQCTSYLKPPNCGIRRKCEDSMCYWEADDVEGSPINVLLRIVVKVFENRRHYTTYEIIQHQLALFCAGGEMPWSFWSSWLPEDECRPRSSPGLRKALHGFPSILSAISWPVILRTLTRLCAFWSEGRILVPIWGRPLHVSFSWTVRGIGASATWLGSSIATISLPWDDGFLPDPRRCRLIELTFSAMAVALFPSSVLCTLSKAVISPTLCQSNWNDLPRSSLANFPRLLAKSLTSHVVLPL